MASTCVWRCVDVFVCTDFENEECCVCVSFVGAGGWVGRVMRNQLVSLFGRSCLKAGWLMNRLLSSRPGAFGESTALVHHNDRDGLWGPRWECRVFSIITSCSVRPPARRSPPRRVPRSNCTCFIGAKRSSARRLAPSTPTKPISVLEFYLSSGCEFLNS